MPLGHFPESLLSADEDLVLDLRPHWMALVRPAFQTIAIVTGMIVAWLLIRFSWGGWLYVGVFFLGLVLVAMFPARPFTRWITSHFVVTTDRVIRRSGWIAKMWIEIPLEKISDVRYHQTIPERLIGAGDLTIESAGRSGQEPFENVRHPERVQKVIFEMKERNEAKRELEPSSVAAWGPSSVAEELNKLHQLVGRGILTEDEFKAVKNRLLRRV
jgi:uncharacterized membrane protein YdbT with pleckstrin-like domain